MASCFRSCRSWNYQTISVWFMMERMLEMYQKWDSMACLHETFCGLKLYDPTLKFCNTCFFPDVCGLPLLSLSNNTDPLADLEPNPLLSLSGGFCSQIQISLVLLHGNHEEWHLQNKRKIMHYPIVYSHSLHGRFNIFTPQCTPALHITEKRRQKFPCQWMSTHTLIMRNAVNFSHLAELFQVATGQNSTWGLT